jgi:hypothetical protein
MVQQLLDLRSVFSELSSLAPSGRLAKYSSATFSNETAAASFTLSILLPPDRRKTHICSGVALSGRSFSPSMTSRMVFSIRAFSS